MYAIYIHTLYIYYAHGCILHRECTLIELTDEARPSSNCARVVQPTPSQANHEPTRAWPANPPRPFTPTSHTLIPSSSPPILIFLTECFRAAAAQLAESDGESRVSFPSLAPCTMRAAAAKGATHASSGGGSQAPPQLFFVRPCSLRATAPEHDDL
jgi:hypothetical protein